MKNFLSLIIGVVCASKIERKKGRDTDGQIDEDGETQREKDKLG